jgi:hypothetical protein
MKLIFKLFGKIAFTHFVQTKEVEKVFAGANKISHKDFGEFVPLLQDALKKGIYYSPLENIRIHLEAFQIANLLKNVGYIGSEDPESEPSIEVTYVWKSIQET